eukprot:TRINITY_DN2051_c0_g1_i8.p1 TRINITY_DN2051_c0_g1~~TRINITY_DN2051_c0_g1_i8.p1  ORF type:complete len:453 (+),score=103.14 TRINITY_DN2051_c0_g1_i8:865-2223(+)
MGAERRSAEISPDNRRLTAYHEGGHALVATYTPGADPVHKATVVPRGRSLGMVMQLPERDTTSLSRRQMLARLDVMMAGRAAEALIFGEDHVTSGASSDFEQATRLAEAMVTRYGMSDKLGKASYDKAEESPATRAVINAETKALIDASYARAEALLGDKVGELHALAGSLLEHETLTGEEVRLAATGTLRKAPPVAPVRVPATGGAAGVSSGSGPPRGAPVPAGLPASTQVATESTRRDATPAASAAPVTGTLGRPLQRAEDVPAAAVAVAAAPPPGTPADAPRVAVVVPPSGGSLEAAAAVAAAAVAAASGKAEAAEGKSLSEGFKSGAGRPARDPVAVGRDWSGCCWFVPDVLPLFLYADLGQGATCGHPCWPCFAPFCLGAAGQPQTTWGTVLWRWQRRRWCAPSSARTMQPRLDLAPTAGSDLRMYLIECPLSSPTKKTEDCQGTQG